MFSLDLNEITDKISDKIKPVLEQGKKQAEVSLLASIITQIYSAEIMRGGNPQINACIGIAEIIVREAKRIRIEK